MGVKMLKLDNLTNLLVTAYDFLKWHLQNKCTFSKNCNCVNFANYNGTFNGNNVVVSANHNKYKQLNIDLTVNGINIDVEVLANDYDTFVVDLFVKVDVKDKLVSNDCILLTVPGLITDDQKSYDFILDCTNYLNLQLVFV